MRCRSSHRSNERDPGTPTPNPSPQEDREWSCWGDTSTTLHRRASASFRRPASRSPSESSGNTCSTNNNGGSLGDKLYVTGVMVATCCRRQGLGASLLQAVEEHAQELRTPYICMFVEPSNAAALALYTRRAGFHFVPYSPTAEAFAAAIGLYKGPYAARQYAFVYKRLELPPAPATPQGADNGGGGGGGGGAESSRRLVLDDAQAATLPFPARMPVLGSSFFS